MPGPITGYKPSFLKRNYDAVSNFFGELWSGLKRYKYEKRLQKKREKERGREREVEQEIESRFNFEDTSMEELEHYETGRDRATHLIKKVEFIARRIAFKVTMGQATEFNLEELILPEDLRAMNESREIREGNHTDVQEEEEEEETTQEQELPELDCHIKGTAKAAFDASVDSLGSHPPQAGAEREVLPQIEKDAVDAARRELPKTFFWNENIQTIEDALSPREEQRQNRIALLKEDLNLNEASTKDLILKATPVRTKAQDEGLLAKKAEADAANAANVANAENAANAANAEEPIPEYVEEVATNEVSSDVAQLEKATKDLERITQNQGSKRDKAEKDILFRTIGGIAATGLGTGGNTLLPDLDLSLTGDLNFLGAGLSGSAEVATAINRFTDLHRQYKQGDSNFILADTALEASRSAVNAVRSGFKMAAELGIDSFQGALGGLNIASGVLGTARGYEGMLDGRAGHKAVEAEKKELEMDTDLEEEEITAVSNLLGQVDSAAKKDIAEGGIRAVGGALQTAGGVISCTGVGASVGSVLGVVGSTVGAASTFVIDMSRKSGIKEFAETLIGWKDIGARAESRKAEIGKLSNRDKRTAIFKHAGAPYGGRTEAGLIALRTINASMRDTNNTSRGNAIMQRATRTTAQSSEEMINRRLGMTRKQARDSAVAIKTWWNDAKKGQDATISFTKMRGPLQTAREAYRRFCVMKERVKSKRRGNIPQLA